MNLTVMTPEVCVPGGGYGGSLLNRLRNIDPPTGVDYSALSIPTETHVSKFEDEFKKHYSESTEHSAPPPSIRSPEDSTDSEHGPEEEDTGRRATDQYE